MCAGTSIGLTCAAPSGSQTPGGPPCPGPGVPGGSLRPRRERRPGAPQAPTWRAGSDLLLQGNQLRVVDSGAEEAPSSAASEKPLRLWTTRPARPRPRVSWAACPCPGLGHLRLDLGAPGSHTAPRTPQNPAGHVANRPLSPDRALHRQTCSCGVPPQCPPDPLHHHGALNVTRSGGQGGAIAASQGPDPDCTVPGDGGGRGGWAQAPVKATLSPPAGYRGHGHPSPQHSAPWLGDRPLIPTSLATLPSSVSSGRRPPSVREAGGASGVH